MRAALLAMSLFTPLALTATEATAQSADRAASCTLSGGGLSSAIRIQLGRALPGLDTGGTGSPNLRVDAIVIYAVGNPNNGQPLGGGAYTGPIVCTFADGLLPAQTKYSIASTSANDPISGIDVLASEIQTLVQYERNANANSTIEQLMCLSTKSNNQCFRIFPASGGAS